MIVYIMPTISRRIAVARAKLQVQRQSKSAPPISATPKSKRTHHQWQRSMSHESQVGPGRSEVS